MSGNESFTNEYLGKCVRIKYTDFVKGIHPGPTDILGKLLEQEIITVEECREMSDMSEETRSSHLVNKLFETSHPTAIKTFLEY